MEGRRALRALQSNTLTRGQPRLSMGGGGSTMMRTRKFASTSKTPKISNRADATPSSISSLNNLLPPRRDHMIPFRLDIGHGAPLSFAARNGSMSCHRNTNHRQVTHPVEDMDLDSSNSEGAMSPDGVPPATSMDVFVPTPRSTTALASAAGRDTVHATASCQSIKLAQPFEPNQKMSSHQEYRINGRRISDAVTIGAFCQTNYSPLPEFTDAYMEGVRRAPADNPAVFEKILCPPRRPSQTSLLGTEIGEDEVSLAASDITNTTLQRIHQKQSRIRLMPSFPPREVPLKNSHVRKVASIEVNSGTTSEARSDELMEEWSLPDDAVNTDTEIKIEGKWYMVPRLPPGWIVKVSETHQKPYYVHPDFGTTWQCPINLPAKSKARKIRRKSNHQHPRPKTPTTHSATPTNGSARALSELSFKGSMSDLIKYCQKGNLDDPKGGYEGSVSSCNWSEETGMSSSWEHNHPNTHRVASQSPNEDCDVWDTPIRTDITTPQRKPAPPASKDSELTRLATVFESKTVARHAKKTPSTVRSVRHSSKKAFESGTTSRQKMTRSEESSTVFLQQEQAVASTPRVSIEPRASRSIRQSNKKVLECSNGSGKVADSQDVDTVFIQQERAVTSTPRVSLEHLASRSLRQSNKKVFESRTESGKAPDSKNSHKVSKQQERAVTSTPRVSLELPEVKSNFLNPSTKKFQRYCSPKLGCLQSAYNGRLASTPVSDEDDDVALPRLRTVENVDHAREARCPKIPIPHFLGSTETGSSQLTPKAHASASDGDVVVRCAPLKQKSNTKLSGVLQETASLSGDSRAKISIQLEIDASSRLNRHMELSSDLDDGSSVKDEWSPLCDGPAPSTPPERKQKETQISPSSFDMPQADEEYSSEGNDFVERRVVEHNVASGCGQGSDSRASKTVMISLKNASVSRFSPPSVNEASAPLNDTQLELTNGPEIARLESPPPPKRVYKPRNWRLWNPPFPLCSLQRLDMLMAEQRKRKAATINQKKKKQEAQKRRKAPARGKRNATKRRRIRP